MATADKTKSAEFSMTIMGKTFGLDAEGNPRKQEAGEALLAAAQTLGRNAGTVGEYRGFRMSFYMEQATGKVYLNLQGATTHNVELGTSVLGNLARIENAINGIPQRLLDEFPALGKLGIFEQAIAYFGGWNIKAYLICQDKAQLDAAYGKDESITSNCHVTVAYAPNKVETAKYLSDRLGVTTVIKEQESISYQGGTGIFAKKSVTKSQQEVQRAVLTPDEIMRLPGPVKDVDQNITEPGDMLVFAAGFPPVYGKQILYFLDKIFSERSKIDAPEKSDRL